MLSKSPATEIRIAKLEARIAELEQWNNAVAVCKNHTGRIIASGCYVCIADAFEQENTALLAENERLKKHLREANRGAELNSKVNALLIEEQDALRARVAKLEGWVKMAYFEGHADSECGCEVQWGWETSEARVAIEPPAEVDDVEAQLRETADCAVCEGKPTKQNNPCFLCGARR